MMGSAETVAQGFVRAINHGDLDELAELMTRDHRFVDSLSLVAEGRERVKAAWADYFYVVPDYTIAVQEILCEGPVAVILGVVRGTYAPDGEMDPKNKWETPAAFRALIADGKVAEWRVFADNEPMRKLAQNTATASCPA